MNEEQQNDNAPATEVAAQAEQTEQKQEGDAKPKRSSRSGAARRRRRSGAAKKKPLEGTAAVENGDEAATAGEAVEPQDALPAAEAKKAASPAAKRSGSRSRRGKGSRAKVAPAEVEDEAASEETPPTGGGNLKLLINSEEPEECRVVLLENGKVEAFHIETMVLAQNKGNIYKGRIAAVEPNLQAAFVEIGTGKNGFLPFGDIHPEYYSKEVDPSTHWKDLHIQDVIRKGQEVLVEVVKEATGNKGANMTTYLSLPGRYLVLMPGSDSAGISRKIDDEEQRRHLRDTMNSLKIPEGIGYIVRTASNEITKTALSQDLKYLLNLWDEIKGRGQSMPAPSLIYKEQNVISRFLRDHFTPDIQEILVDTEEAFEQVDTFLQLLPAKQSKVTKVRLHKGSKPIFNLYQVEEQIEQIYQPTVNLPSGGSIVVSPTEALVAIDVNSGRTGKDKSFEETIFLANMEAAEEVGRQLQLRDLGGLIVVDFIDMRDSRHIREVEKKIRASMKRDKAKVDFSKISKFGLMQISRQKMAAPVQQGSYRVCQHCQGRGVVRSVEAQALVYLRRIQTGVTQKNVSRLECQFPLDVAQYLLNRKREDLFELERRYSVAINILPDPAMSPAEHRIEVIKGATEAAG
ncbi:MAG: Rne/Rng family ribonuclease [Desulfobulbaceae bacterium]|nr:Rne/Rng family ribonuclease [Desulfobulbaceae bacterium]